MFSIGGCCCCFFFFLIQNTIKFLLFRKKIKTAQIEIACAMCELQDLPIQWLCWWYLAHYFAVHG